MGAFDFDPAFLAHGVWKHGGRNQIRADVSCQLHLGCQYWYLLDSCMEHTDDRETDGNIQSAVLHRPWTLGLHLQRGILYCANEEWELLREESLGNLYFGENGRYVSGDPELDAIVETLIFQFQQENEESDRYELL